MYAYAADSKILGLQQMDDRSINLLDDVKAIIAISRIKFSVR